MATKSDIEQVEELRTSLTSTDPEKIDGDGALKALKDQRLGYTEDGNINLNFQ